MKISIQELARKYPAASEYITQIYLILRDYSYCNNSRLAEHIGVSASAVSQAVLRLKRQELVSQDRYGMISLSDEGVVLAEQLLRRHYLLEYLMVKRLEFPWELADLEAGQLQDKVSHDFISHLEEFLDYPKTCPHGNPFPDHPEAEKILSAPRLSRCRQGDRIEIVRISEEGERLSGLLHACHEAAVVPGKRFTVDTVSDETVTLMPEGQELPIELQSAFCEQICVYVT
mgnify:CR=1 FL=1